ncbi:Flagellar hook protein FlgE [Buchnera aphidicola (Anoecia corni)]|uniref:Flagellar hook protein FlgE n=1 Tax=Buchnera aphidicola (Anoecia corni) TaxID=2994477 RepID=A0AAT9IG92_9GAMM
MSLESLENSIQKFHNSIQSLQSSTIKHNHKNKVASQYEELNFQYNNANNSPYRSEANFGFEQLDENGSCLSLNKVDKHANRNLYTNISPNAYFRLSDNNDSILYTKQGHFLINEHGDVITEQGYRLTGYNIKGCKKVSEFIDSSIPKNLNLSNAYKIDYKPTTKLALFSYLNMNAPIFTNFSYDYRNESTCTNNIKTVIYNKDGKECIVDLNILKTGNREWTVSTSIHDDSQTASEIPNIFKNENYYQGSDGKTVVCDPFTFKCDENGNIINSKKLINITSSDKRYVTPLSINLESVRIRNNYNIPRDYTHVQANGFPEGTLNKFMIDSEGLISGYYSNGKKLQLAQMSILEVSDPNILSTVSQNISSLIAKENEDNQDRKIAIDYSDGHNLDNKQISNLQLDHNEEKNSKIDIITVDKNNNISSIFTS